MTAKLFRSISSYFLAPAWGVLLSLVLVLAYLIYVQAHEGIENAQAEALALARSSAAYVHREIFEARRILSTYAQRSSVRDMKENQPLTIFNKFPEAFPQYSNFLLVDKAGKVLQSMVPWGASAPPSVADQPWFQTVAEGQKFTVDNLSYDPAADSWVCHLAVPVRSSAGAFRGSLCAVLDVNRFHQILTEFSMSQDAEMTVLDRNGRVVATTTMSGPRVGQVVRELEISQVVLDSWHGRGRVPGFDAVDRFFGFSTIPTADWKIVVGIPAADLLAPVKSRTIRSGLLAIGVAVLATVLALFLGGQVIRPVRRLAQGLEEAAADRHPGPLPVGGPREIAELTQAFNRVAADRLRVQQSLQATEEKYRVLTEKSLTGVYIFQGDTFAYVNPRMTKIFGYSAAELTGMAAIDLVAPEDVPRVSEYIQSRLQGRSQHVHYTCACRRKDGQRIEIEVFGQRIDLDGQPALIGTLIEITERRDAERALSATEEKFRVLAEQSLTGVYMLQQNRFTYANPRLAEIFGYTAEEFLQLDPVDDLVAPADRDMVRENLERRLAGQVTHARYAWRGVRKDQAVIEVEVFGGRVDLAGQPAIIGALIDVTDRNRSEAQLRRSEENYRTLFEQAVVGIFLADAQGRLLEANSFGCQLLGLPVEQIRGRHVTEFVATEEVPDVRATLEGLRAGRTFDKERRFTRADGSVFYAEITSRLLPDGRLLGLLRDITARKEAEASLRNAKEYVDNIIRTANVMIIGLDRAGTITVFNETAEKITGYTAAELKDQNWFEVLAPRDRYPEVWQEFQRLLAGETPRQFENPILTKNGEERFITWSNSTIREQTEIVGTISFGNDLTEIRRAEQALRQSEEQYRMLADTSTDMISRHAADGRVLFVSPACQSMLGYTPAEVRNLSAEEQVYAEDYDRVWQTIHRHAAQGDTYRSEHRILKKDGTPVWVETTGRLLKDAQTGALKEFLCVTRDISERKRAEEQLRESEENFRNLAEESPNMIFINQRGRVIYANRRCTELMGYRRDEFLAPDFSFLTLMAPESLELVQQAFQMHQRDEEVPSCEYDLITKDGARINSIITTKLIQFRGQPSILGIVTDITEQKRTGEALRKVSARLLQTQEEVQRRIARELHDTTGQNLFALNMNLQVVQGSRSLSEPKAQRALADAMTLAQESTQQLRTYSYLLHPPVLEDLGLRGALRDYALGFEERSGIGVECDLAAELDPLSKDIEISLFRVVQEGLINIHRHSGSPTAAIRLWQEENEIWLEVADKGHGIPPEKLQAVQSLSDAVSVGIPGMRERIRLQGGQLRLHSGPTGTVLQAIVPLAPAAAGPAPDRAVPGDGNQDA